MTQTSIISTIQTVCAQNPQILGFKQRQNVLLGIVRNSRKILTVGSVFSEICGCFMI